MCVHVCTHMCTYIYIYVYIHMQVRMCTQIHTYTHYARTHIRGSTTQRICATNTITKPPRDPKGYVHGGKIASGMLSWKYVHKASACGCPKEPSFCIWILWIHRNKIRPFLIEVALAKVICIRPSISVSAPETPSAQKQNRNRAILKGLSKMRGC